MALVLSLRAGHDFYVGDKRVVVSWIDSPHKFGLKKSNGVAVPVDDSDWVPLFEGVRVMAGVPKNPYQNRIVLLVVDAPNVKVLRGPLYRKTSGVVCEACKGTGKLRDKVQCEKCKGFGCSHCGGSGYATSEFKCPDCGECDGIE